MLGHPGVKICSHLIQSEWVFCISMLSFHFERKGGVAKTRGLCMGWSSRIITNKTADVKQKPAIFVTSLSFKKVVILCFQSNLLGWLIPMFERGENLGRVQNSVKGDLSMKWRKLVLPPRHFSLAKYASSFCCAVGLSLHFAHEITTQVYLCLIYQPPAYMLIYMSQRNSLSPKFI